MIDWRKEVFVPVPIEPFNERYLVSNHGRVWSLKRSKFLKQHTMIKPWTHSYQKVVLKHTGKQKNIAVHRLVALAFIPNPDNHPTVDHINGVHHENPVWNLRWMSMKENSAQGGTASKNNPKRMKIQALEREEVRRLYAEGGASHKSLSKKYGVAPSTIGRIVNEKGPSFC